MDIVERLRNVTRPGSPVMDGIGYSRIAEPDPLAQEAATEITRLREENKDLEHRLMLATAFGQEEAGAHNEASAEVGRLLEENKVMREALEWKPISTYEEGVYALFLLPQGERGVPVVETAMAFWDERGMLEAWTNGGPNSGLDFEFASQPIYWREADVCTNYDDLLAIATALATTGGE